MTVPSLLLVWGSLRLSPVIFLIQLLKTKNTTVIVTCYYVQVQYMQNLMTMYPTLSEREFQCYKCVDVQQNVLQLKCSTLA